MPETMKVVPIEVLAGWMLAELDGAQSMFGIHRSLFYTPRPDAPFAGRLFGHALATPVGPAAGPHTQLAQNILSAWLCGGRFIELKTVQVMDELEIPRPCIDVADEGYNVEWSQELKLEQSAAEYIKAWVLVHVLHQVLGWSAQPLGTIFNMSVGYNLAGIRQPAMQRFMDRLQDASAEIEALCRALRARFPHLPIDPRTIPGQVCNSVTLSTMHGCPPDEIEAIATYLLAERGLHTTVKLNPTLLGQEAVLGILHDDLGFREIDIPDRVFAHDLRYERAVELIRSLQQAAAGRGLQFGVKLSNTLAMANHRGVLPGDEMYMSGRALYPVTMSLFARLARELDGGLSVSYSAGADAWNVATILSCGALPVTAASDLLKPGGYARLGQWLENLEAEMRARRAASLQALAAARLDNLEAAAAQARQAAPYKKSYNPFDLPKVESGLAAFDCIAAPCVEQCAVCQDVPEYAWLIAHGDDERALQVILQRNPLPGITGYICTHLCQTRCTRSAGNYDQPVAIRDLKRFAVEQGIRESGTRYQVPDTQSPVPGTRFPIPSSASVAVVGSGPAGLAAAYFLARSGVRVTILEAREMAGGMPAIAPHFRLPPAVVQADVDRIVGLGVELKLNHPVTVPPEALLAEGFDAVYLGPGLQKDATLEIEGSAGQGVFTALRLLEAVARGQVPALGERVLVIGGGNTAMDVARTARRLTGQPATVVYRRSRQEMPAEPEEMRDLLDERNVLIELATPRRVILEQGRVTALECVRNELGAPGPDGRRRPVPVPGSEFQIPATAIILAIGQVPDLAFLDGSRLSLQGDGTLATDPGSRATPAPGIYAGGDLARGPAIIVQACADGRRAAEAICHKLGVAFCPPAPRAVPLSEDEILQVKRARARKLPPHEPGRLPVAQRDGFDLVAQALSPEAARAEARRCLQCSTVCDKCVEVCPNRANVAYCVEPVRWTLPLLRCDDQGLRVEGTEEFEVRQSRQIVHVPDFCNECGNCATFCVHHGRPYADKPRLFLDEAAFRQADGNAFYLEGNAIRRREGGQEITLSANDQGSTLESRHVRLTLSAAWQVQTATLKEPFEGHLSLREAAEMAVLLHGVQGSVSLAALQVRT